MIMQGLLQTGRVLEILSVQTAAGVNDDAPLALPFVRSSDGARPARRRTSLARDRGPGEEPGAVVHLKPGTQASEEEIRAFVAGKLAGFKVPVRVAFWPETLPRNANGKIMKTELKRVFAA